MASKHWISKFGTGIVNSFLGKSTSKADGPSLEERRRQEAEEAKTETLNAFDAGEKSNLEIEMDVVSTVESQDNHKRVAESELKNKPVQEGMAVEQTVYNPNYQDNHKLVTEYLETGLWGTPTNDEFSEPEELIRENDTKEIDEFQEPEELIRDEETQEIQEEVAIEDIASEQEVEEVEEEIEFKSEFYDLKEDRMAKRQESNTEEQVASDRHIDKNHTYTHAEVVEKIKEANTKPIGHTFVVVDRQKVDAAFASVGMTDENQFKYVPEELLSVYNESLKSLEPEKGAPTDPEKEKLPVNNKEHESTESLEADTQGSETEIDNKDSWSKEKLLAYYADGEEIYDEMKKFLFDQFEITEEEITAWETKEGINTHNPSFTENEDIIKDIPEIRAEKPDVFAKDEKPEAVFATRDEDIEVEGTNFSAIDDTEDMPNIMAEGRNPTPEELAEAGKRAEQVKNIVNNTLNKPEPSRLSKNIDNDNYQMSSVNDAQPAKNKQDINNPEVTEIVEETIIMETVEPNIDNEIQTYGVEYGVDEDTLNAHEREAFGMDKVELAKVPSSVDNSDKVEDEDIAMDAITTQEIIESLSEDIDKARANMSESYEDIQTAEFDVNPDNSIATPLSADGAEPATDEQLNDLVANFNR